MRKIAKDKEGYSPLQLASAYSQLDSTVILLRHYLQSAKFGLFIIFRYDMSRMIRPIRYEMMKIMIRLGKHHLYTR